MTSFVSALNFEILEWEQAQYFEKFGKNNERNRAPSAAKPWSVQNIVQSVYDKFLLFYTDSIQSFRFLAVTDSIPNIQLKS